MIAMDIRKKNIIASTSAGDMVCAAARCFVAFGLHSVYVVGPTKAIIE